MSCAARAFCLCVRACARARVQVRAEVGFAPDEQGGLRVVPLFETLEDLQAAEAVMTTLFSNPWYASNLASSHHNCQEVMLGYSDSGEGRTDWGTGAGGRGAGSMKTGAFVAPAPH